MNAKYTEICKVSNLEAAFQKVPLVQFVLNFHNIIIIMGINHIEVKYIFSDKNSRKSPYYRNCIGQTKFLAVNLILG